MKSNTFRIGHLLSFDGNSSFAVHFPYSIFISACSIPSGGGDTNPCGSGLIVPGECIDGVKLGDSREAVKELLGNRTYYE